MVDTTPHLLGVFAHPDDEVFCAGGTFAKAAASGGRVSVLSATRGEAGQIRDGSVASRQTLPEVRERELRTACQRLSVDEVRLLGHVDGTLADVGPERLAAEVGAVIEELRPDALVTFGEDGAYGHPDHVTIGRAAVVAAHGAQRPIPVYASIFPRRRIRMRDRLARWLVGLDAGFFGTPDFMAALALFAPESATMGFACDDVAIRWFPPGFTVIEQGEFADSLYLILSGEADVLRREAPDLPRRRVRGLGPGAFFGERGVAHQTPRTADVVATSGLTCLVLSERAAPFGGRGEDARLTGGGGPVTADEAAETIAADVTVDVRGHVGEKVEAIAAHRSQYPIDPAMFPADLLRDMFGTEWFRRAGPPPQGGRDLLPR